MDNRLQQIWRAFDEVSNLPYAEWTPDAVAGKFISQCSAHYGLTHAVDVNSIVSGVSTLILRHGATDTCRAIDLLFSEEMKWVTQKSLGFLLNPNTWNKHVFPNLGNVTQAKVGGEFAEHTGPRPSGRGFRRVR